MAKKTHSKKNDLFFKSNYQIKAPEVRLVGENIEVGIYSIKEANDKANELGLDLIEISPNATPPVCKIQEYSKYIYDMKKKKKDNEKKNRLNKVELKEIRFGPNTDDNDFNWKKNNAEGFLKDGNRLKAFVFFKGREMMFKEKGQIILLKLAEQLEDVGTVEGMPKMDGNKMSIYIKPKK